MPLEAATLAAEVTLLKLLKTLETQGMPDVLRVETALGELHAVLLVGAKDKIKTPPPESPEKRKTIGEAKSPCERDLLEWFKKQPRRKFTGDEAIAGLELFSSHGPSTIRAALTRLVRVGLLDNARDKRGYSLPFEKPLE